MKVVEGGLSQGDHQLLKMRDGLRPPCHGHLSGHGSGDEMSQCS